MGQLRPAAQLVGGAGVRPAGVGEVLEVGGGVAAGLLLLEEAALGAEEVADHLLTLTQDAAGLEHHAAASVDDVHVLEDGVGQAAAGLMHDEISEVVTLLLSQGHDFGVLVIQVILLLVPYRLGLEDIQLFQACFPALSHALLLLAHEHQLVNKRVR